MLGRLHVCTECWACCSDVSLQLPRIEGDDMDQSPLWTRRIIQIESRRRRRVGGAGAGRQGRGRVLCSGPARASWYTAGEVFGTTSVQLNIINLCSG
eukprot:6236753-Prymnesium_polylepis.5